MILLAAPAAAILAILFLTRDEAEPIPGRVVPVPMVASASPSLAEARKAESAAPGQAAHRDKVKWLADPSAALRLAAEKNLPAVIYFMHPSEFGCQVMTRSTLADDSVAAHLAEKTATCRVEFGREHPLARLYGVGYVPVAVVLDSAGGYAGAVVGHRPPDRWIEELAALEAAAARRLRACREHEAALDKAQGEERRRILYALAQAEADRKLFKSAAARLRELTAAAPEEDAFGKPSVFEQLGDALASSGDLDGALSAYGEAGKRDRYGVSGEALAFKAALATMRLGKAQDAVVLWRSLLDERAKGGRNRLAEYNLALSLHRAGQHGEAAKILAGLVKDAPGDEAFFEAWLLLREIGRAGAAADERDSVRRRQYLDDCVADGRALSYKYSCTDCHQMEPSSPPGISTCLGCHMFVRSILGDEDLTERVLSANAHMFRGIARTKHQLHMPNLTAVAARIRPEWIHEFLNNPYDVRPHLEDSMIQANLPREHVDVFIRYFRAVAELQGLREIPAAAWPDPGGAPAAERAAKGEGLLLKNRCYDCHQIGNRRFAAVQGSWPMDQGRAEAPDLRFARRRLRREAIAEWIFKPKALFSGTKMPQFPISREEAATIAEFILGADPQVRDDPLPAWRLPKLARTPAYDEAAAIFHDSCVHCHMPDKQGGAGNVGAYGFPARRLDLSTYAGIVRGSLQADGTRADIVASRGGKPSLLIERLVLRRDENRRDFVAPFEERGAEPWLSRTHFVSPGMPMGIPSLTPEQIQVLESWAAGGAPGPAPVELDERHKGPAGVGH